MGAVLVIEVRSAPAGNGPEADPPPAVGPGGRGPGDGPRHATLVAGGSGEQTLGHGLVEQAGPAVRQGQECLVVAGGRLGPAVDEAVRFARQALRTTAVTALHLDAAELAVAVAVGSLRRALSDDAVCAGAVRVGLTDLAATVVRLTVHRTPFPRRCPPPRPTERLSLVGRRATFTVVDGAPRGVVLRHDAAPGEALRHLPPRLRSRSVRAVVAAGADPDDVRLVERMLSPVPVSVLPHFTAPAGRRRPIHVVLSPADLQLWRTGTLRAAAASWPCSWCGTRLCDPTGCAGCGADFGGRAARPTLSASFAGPAAVLAVDGALP